MGAEKRTRAGAPTRGGVNSDETRYTNAASASRDRSHRHRHRHHRHSHSPHNGNRRRSSSNTRDRHRHAHTRHHSGEGTPDGKRARRSETPNDGRLQYNGQDGDRLVAPTAEYKLVRKLGKGTFAGVWLCEYLGPRDRHRELCAIKVVHDIHRHRDASRIEARMIRDVQRADRGRGQSGCVQLLDTFYHHGHHCLVFPRYGPSLYNLIESNGRAAYSTEGIRAVLHGLLRAVAFLHSLAIVHTDIKPENVLLKHPTLMMDGQRRLRPVSYEVVLIDFGSAQYDDEYKGRTVQTRNYRAPETIITDGGWSFASDVWSVGCMAVELLTTHVLFGTDDDAEHLFCMEHALRQSFPSHLVRTGTPEFFRDGRVDWDKARTKSADLTPVRHLCSDMGDRAFDDLVDGLLTLHPDKRMTAKEALNAPFLRSVDW
eukprot:Rhum_TRINITY_DN362_c0_g1::Rhum_TRINITY_DN362_c0_g1_i1::g.1187::m.1187